MCVRIAIQNPPFVPSMYIEDDGAAYLDISDDFSLRFSKRLEELTDVNTIKTDSVLGFSVPTTPKNDVILKSALSPNRVDNVFAGFPVILYLGSSVVSQKTLFPIRRSSTEYEIEVRNSIEHWAVLGKDLLLNSLKLREDDFEFTNTNINEINDLGAYEDGEEVFRFPVAYYGQFTDKRIIPPLVNPQHIGVGDFRPYFSILGLLQKAFCSIGWSFRSPILESDYGRRLLTYIINKDYGADEETANARDLRIELEEDLEFPTEVGNYAPIPFLATNDPSGGWFVDGARYKTAGIYDITGTLRLKVTIGDVVNAHVTLGANGLDRVYYMYTRIAFDLPNGENYGLERIELGFSLADLILKPEFEDGIILDIKINKTNFQLDAGSSVYFPIGTDEPLITEGIAKVELIKEGSYIEFDCKRVLIDRGDILPINSLIDPEYNLLDFIKGVAHLFAGKFLTDYRTNEVWLYSTYSNVIFDDEEVEGFFDNNGEYEDYTELAQEDSEVINSVESDLNRYYLLKFKGDGDEAIKELKLPDEKPFLSYKVDFGDTVKNTDVAELENPFFEATVNKYYYKSDSDAPVNMPHLLDNTADDGKYDLSFDINPRVLYWAGKVPQVIRTPNGYREVPLRIFGQNTNNIPTAYQWSDINYGTPLDFDYSEFNVAYGEHVNSLRPETTDKDLYHFFYQKWMADSIFNLTIDILLFLEQAKYLGIDFRKYVMIRALGRDILGRLIEVNDYNSCKFLSTPVLFMPNRQVSDDCNPLPDGGGDNGNDVCKQNAPLLIVEKEDDCYTFSLGGSSTSTIDTVIFEWQYLGGVWTAATSLCNPEDAFVVKMTVTYTDGCPKIVRTVNVDACGNAPVLTPSWDSEEECFTIEIEGTIISEIDEAETLIEYSLDGGDTWETYTGTCTEIGEEELILIRATVVYVDGCADSEITGEFTVPIPTDCNLTDADVECDSNGILTLTGNVFGVDALDIIRYRPMGQDYWFIWDGAMRIRPEPIQFQRIIIFCNNTCPTYCSDIHTWEG